LPEFILKTIYLSISFEADFNGDVVLRPAALNQKPPIDSSTRSSLDFVGRSCPSDEWSQRSDKDGADRASVLKTSAPADFRDLFSGSEVVSKLMKDIAVMSTFGIACPLLLICVAMNFCSVMLTWRLKIRRWVALRESISGLGQVSCLRLEQAMATMKMRYGSVILMVVTTTGLFWSLFVFDMIGDVYGPFTGGLVVLIPTLGEWLLYGVLELRVNKAMSDPPGQDEQLDANLKAKLAPILQQHSELNSQL
jgi:hypothetical protein